MVDQIGVMVAAVVTSVGVMLVAAKPIGDFVDAHPSVKVLALAFLVMVGMALTAEAFDAHVPKGYIYAAMASRWWWRRSTSAPARSASPSRPRSDTSPFLEVMLPKIRIYAKCRQPSECPIASLFRKDTP